MAGHGVSCRYAWIALALLFDEFVTRGRDLLAKLRKLALNCPFFLLHRAVEWVILV
jgi:hypothetical protein